MELEGIIVLSRDGARLRDRRSAGLVIAGALPLSFSG